MRWCTGMLAEILRLPAGERANERSAPVGLVQGASLLPTEELDRQVGRIVT